MSLSFKISIEKNLQTALKEVESTIVDNGGKFQGNATQGQFSGKTILGKVKGEYVVLSENEIEILITKKPFIAPNSKIESAIRKYFS